MRRFGEKFNRVHELEVRFLKTDLDVGLTRARIAAQTKHGSEKWRRNATEAKKAYDAVLQFRAQTELRPEQASSIDEKLTELRKAIEELGLDAKEKALTE